MGFLLFIVYMFIGAFLCGLYTYLSSKIQRTDHEYDVLVAVLTGLFFPANYDRGMPVPVSILFRKAESNGGRE